MIIYGCQQQQQQQHGGGCDGSNGADTYKMDAKITDHSINSSAAKTKRLSSAPLRKLTSENCSFLRKLGLKLKKVKKKNTKHQNVGI